MGKIVFSYRGKNSQGEQVSGSVEALDKEDALAKLRLLEAQGFHDLNIEGVQTVESPQQQQNPTIVVVQNPATKSKHGLPALLSFFIPGLGQLVKGQILKAIFIFIMYGVSVLMIFVMFIGIPMLIILWLWSMVDAYNS